MSRDDTTQRDPTSEQTVRLQERVNSLLVSSEALEVAGAPDTFSPYDDADLQRATELANEMMTVADEQGASGLEAAIGVAERSLPFVKAGLVPYAVQLFLAHHSQAKRTLRTPALSDRVLPSSRRRASPRRDEETDGT